MSINKKCLILRIIENNIFLGNAGIWVQTHVIYYRPLKEEPTSTGRSSNVTSSHSSRKGKGSSSKSTSRRKGDDLWNGNMLIFIILF